MRSPDNTDDYLRDLLAARLGKLPVAVAHEASLMSDLGADSLNLVSLIMEIEDELDIDIPDEDAMQLVTVKQLMDYVTFAAAAKEMRRVRQVKQPHQKAVGHP